MSDDFQKKVFAKNLNALLYKYSKSQKEVADAIGVIPQTFNTWCNAQAIPRMGKIQALSDYFGINKSELIEDKIEEQEYYINEETAQMAQEIYKNKELSLLFDAARDVDTEDLKMVHDMLLRLKRAERGEE